MLPEKYKIVAVASFGSSVTVQVELTTYKIDPATGNKAHTQLGQLINDTGTDQTVETAQQDGTLDYGLHGVLHCNPGGSVTGRVDLFLMTVEQTLESEPRLSEPLASLSFAASSAAQLTNFEKN